jgi:hypothetical protein
VAEVQSKQLKRRWRVFAYAIGLTQAVRNLQPFFVKLDLNGKPAWSGSVYQVSVGNGRFHGGGLTVAEDAVADDVTASCRIDELVDPDVRNGSKADVQGQARLSPLRARSGHALAVIVEPTLADFWAKSPRVTLGVIPK